ncbi:uncharacterized protein MICPUCDRAFT_7164, partial [Micromonas pusilla CCMP1545]
LGSNHIGDAGAAALGDALGPGVPIARVNVRDNQVGVLGCRAFGRAVARCSTTLTRLDLAHSGFGDAGAVALADGLKTTRAPCALKVLQLGFNSVGAVGAKALVEALTTGWMDALRHLDLACNGAADGERSGVSALMKALEKNDSLRVLNARGNDLTPRCAGDVAEMLMENVALRRLNVGYNKIYDEGAWELMEALSENSTLRGLDVQRNEISDEGGRHVESLLRANATLTEV